MRSSLMLGRVRKAKPTAAPPSSDVGYRLPKIAAPESERRVTRLSYDQGRPRADVYMSQKQTFAGIQRDDKPVRDQLTEEVLGAQIEPMKRCVPSLTLLVSFKQDFVVLCSESHVTAVHLSSLGIKPGESPSVWLLHF